MSARGPDCLNVTAMSLQPGTAKLVSAKKWPADQVQGQKIGRLKADISLKTEKELSDNIDSRHPDSLAVLTWLQWAITL
jgi:hypothetical protein